MGLFDKLFKAQNQNNNIDYTSNENIQTTAYFTRGIVVKTVPKFKGSLYDNRDKINSSRYVVSDGITYDLEDIQSIASMPIPKFRELTDMGVVGSLDYVLRMKASLVRESGNHPLSIAILQKANSLMLFSPVEWQQSDYTRLVLWLYEDGRFDEADQYDRFINDKFADEPVDLFPPKSSRGQDLYEAEYVLGCCGECAKYRGRWFSVSGKDKRFPKLPEPYTCECGGLSFMPVVYGLSEPDISGYRSRVNIIEYSNRPFKDNRSRQEKADFQYTLDEKHYKAIEYNDKKTYYKLAYLLPNDIPKSFSGYKRMKNANTVNFVKLSEKARDIGIDINYSKEEQKIVNRYLEYRKRDKT